MAKLTSAALAAHELGLAATFGGIVFGQSGLGKAVKVLPNQNDRSRVLEQSWKTFAIPKTIGVITAGATWLIGRSIFSGRFSGRDIRRLVIAKDVALGITVLSGLGAQVVGGKLSSEQPFPIEAKASPRRGRLRTWRRCSGRCRSGLRAARRGRDGPGADLRPEHPRPQEPALGSRRAVPALSLDTASHRFYTTRPN